MTPAAVRVQRLVELSRCAALRGGRLWSMRGRGVSRARGEAGRWETGWQGESLGGVRWVGADRMAGYENTTALWASLPPAIR